jgi:hypothetical protein
MSELIWYISPLMHVKRYTQSPLVAKILLRLKPLLINEEPRYMDA